MAPVNNPDHNAVEHQLKNVIQDLYEIMVQVTTYDTSGRPSRDILEKSLLQLSTSLRTVHQTSSPSPSSNNPNPKPNLPVIPYDVIQYVDAGRNPDIYTREFVELTRKGNQLMRGKMDAFASFRDILAGEIGKAMPELGEDVERTVESTKG